MPDAPHEPNGFTPSDCDLQEVRPGTKVDHKDDGSNNVADAIVIASQLALEAGMQVGGSYLLRSWSPDRSQGFATSVFTVYHAFCQNVTFCGRFSSARRETGP
jgi:hypothetical protein